MIDIDAILEKSSSEIFSTYNLTQIQQISDDLSKISKSKHQELRSLVSSKYRDLLKTGDDIIAIKDLGISQDRSLYNLSFCRGPKLDKISTVDKNLKIFNQHVFDRELDIHETLDRDSGNIESVLLNSDFWISITPLLEIVSTTSLDVVLETLVEFNKFRNDTKFTRLFIDNRDIIQKKVTEISALILDKLTNDTLKASELSSIYHQIHLNNLRELEKLQTTSIDSQIYNNLIRILENEDENNLSLQQHIKTDDSNDQIFTDFPEFNSRFQAHLSMKLKSLQDILTSSISSYHPDSTIDLYTLQFQDSQTGSGFNKEKYLLDIYYLSIGVDNGVLVKIIEKLIRFKQLLTKFIKFFSESEDTETYSSVLEDIIKSLKSKTDSKNNVALDNHLDSLMNA
ncbi:hypothetical protein WICPIJ_001192 [Wickerhamomyces pijperi]|uniref:Uncharacterized protein n=1 Tax=Wickerhamomyces pijperi TaxID=599730 RepID=A0A9P8QC21_WICPI|nr:hypothetical protein WICPIJ_001192 [Wickerhamomyces pijperi]